MPDRIELGTIACAAAVTGGEVFLEHARTRLLGATGPALAEAGVALEDAGTGLIARRSSAGLTGIDLHTPIMAMLSTAKGASIAVHGRAAWVRGVERLTGARVTATDVRAAAALVLAALGATGETVIDGLHHLDRGYDRLADKLAACGAAITRSMG